MWWRVLFSAVLLALSQPFVVPLIGKEPIDPTGFSGLLVLFAYVPVLSFAWDKKPSKVFWLFLFTGIVQYFILYYWLHHAIIIFGHLAWYISAFAVLLLATTVGLHTAIAAFLAQKITLLMPKWRWLIWPSFICTFEWLRNFGPCGGFPWGNVGYSLTQVPAFLQSTALVGVYGLIFYIVLTNVLLFYFWKNRNANVISVKSGIHKSAKCWIPACAGMTNDWSASFI